MILVCLSIVISFEEISQLSCYAQSALKVQTVEAKPVGEPGCPVSISAVRADLEIDAFDVPQALRVYIDYKNESEKTTEAVKFRVRLLDGEGTNRGTYQSSDVHSLTLGQTAFQKSRREGIDPKVKQVLVRLLEVKFSDGSLWQSTHLPAGYRKDGKIDKSSSSPAETSE